MKRIRILHTADIHLDSTFAALGAAPSIGNRLRAAQRDVFAHILHSAQHWPADVVVIAGDLFEAAYIQPDTLSFLLESLEQLAPIPALIAPGNRDPFTDASPYAMELWPDNVHIFKPGGWSVFEHPSLPLTVHGIGCDGVDDTGAWFRDLHVPEDGCVHIAVAHGTERAHKPPEGKVFAPFDAMDIAQEGLTYLALGHIHGMTSISGEFSTVMSYAGTPQGRCFAEVGLKSFNQVEITRTDLERPLVRVAAAPSSQAVFETRRWNAFESSDLEGLLALRSEAESLDDRHRVVRLDVTATPLSRAQLEALRREAQGRFLHADVVHGPMVPEVSPSLGGARTGATQLLQLLESRIQDAPDEDRAAFESHVRDLALAACCGVELPAWAAAELVP